ncbi:hypothetical protein ABQX22_13800 [Xanthomonas sp. WHRI 1810A]|uniref:hypothetical protein n=1 Tax=Xanthomonas sp. WHRI 1810A TaxID=3161565 RepID=UPI0032E92B3A
MSNLPSPRHPVLPPDVYHAWQERMRAVREATQMSQAHLESAKGEGFVLALSRAQIIDNHDTQQMRTDLLHALMENSERL